MVSRTVQICNRLGLHARAAAKLVHTSSGFRSSVRIRKDHDEVDGKSILGILLLAAACGTKIDVVCDGEDEEAACRAVEDLIARRFDEED